MKKYLIIFLSLMMIGLTACNPGGSNPGSGGGSSTSEKPVEADLNELAKTVRAGEGRWECPAQTETYYLYFHQEEGGLFVDIAAKNDKTVYKYQIVKAEYYEGKQTYTVHLQEEGAPSVSEVVELDVSGTAYKVIKFPNWYDGMKQAEYMFNEGAGPLVPTGVDLGEMAKAVKANEGRWDCAAQITSYYVEFLYADGHLKAKICNSGEFACYVYEIVDATYDEATKVYTARLHEDGAPAGSIQEVVSIDVSKTQENFLYFPNWYDEMKQVEYYFMSGRHINEIPFGSGEVDYEAFMSFIKADWGKWETTVDGNTDWVFFFKDIWYAPYMMAEYRGEDYYNFMIKGLSYDAGTKTFKVKGVQEGHFGSLTTELTIDVSKLDQGIISTYDMPAGKVMKDFTFVPVRETKIWTHWDGNAAPGCEPTLTLYDDGSYRFYENTYSTMAYLRGPYEETASQIICRVYSRHDLTGFAGQETETIVFNKQGDKLVCQTDVCFTRYGQTFDPVPVMPW